MRVGLVLPVHAGAVADAARLGEQMGFDSLWVVDAINRGVMLADPFVSLGVAAGATTRIELGTAVVQPALRAPFLLAHQVGSLAAASGGRLVLGVGAGSSAADFAAVGRDHADRFRLLTDHLDAMRRLLGGQEVDGARLTPWPDLPAVPILVGAWSGGRWIRKAATEFDGWIGSAHATTLEQLIDGLGRFREIGGSKRAIAANIDATRPDLAEFLIALADAGFDDATLRPDRYDAEGIRSARRLWPG